MIERITKNRLRGIVSRLNEQFGQPVDAWTRDESGNLRATPGVFVLDCAYGGYRLSRVISEGGGERDITPRGTARETYDNIRAFMAGVEAAREAAA
jgi:hypothetical protein